MFLAERENPEKTAEVVEEEERKVLTYTQEFQDFIKFFFYKIFN